MKPGSFDELHLHCHIRGMQYSFQQQACQMDVRIPGSGQICLTWLRLDKENAFCSSDLESFADGT